MFLIGLGGPSLWIDEGHSWRYADEPLGTLLPTVLGSTNAVEAAYYSILHFWIAVAGTSEVALRLPSVLAMTIAVWMAAKTARAIQGNRAAMLAGLAMIALPGVSRYAQEARPYPFAVAAVAVSTYMLWRALEAGERKWWAGFAVALTAAGYFHILSLLVVPGQFVGMLAIERSRWRAFVSAVLAAVILVAPIAVLGLRQSSQVGWIGLVRLDDLWNGLSVLTGSLAVTAVLAAVMVVRGGDRRLVALALPAFLAPPVLLWILGSFASLYLARYLLPAAPAAAVLIGGALAEVRGVRLLAFAAIVVGLVIPAQMDIREPAGHGQDFRSAAALVATDCSASIHYDGLSRDTMAYYLTQHECSPSESASSDRLWVVQGDGPQTTEPGYSLISSTTFGTAIVTYWARK